MRENAGLFDNSGCGCFEALVRNACKIFTNLIFFIMTHKTFSETCVSAVSPVVKIFSAWAIKYTRKDNRYAEYFLLSHKREMKLLSKAPDRNFRRMAEHLWRPETRIQCLKDGRLWELFIDDLQNSTEFQAAFLTGNREEQERAVACKSYTLSDRELVVVCNSQSCFIRELLQKQPASFTEKTVSRMNEEAKTFLFTLIVSGKRIDILSRLDTLLWDARSAQVKELQWRGKEGLALLMADKAYRPNLSAEQLVELPEFELWATQADPLVVADKMVDYWQQSYQSERLMKLANRLVEYGRKDAINKAQQIAALPNQGIALVSQFIKAGIACPRFFKLLRVNDLAGLLERNLRLCCAHGCVNQIPEAELRELPEALREQALIALAYEGALPQRLFDEVAPELKTKLFDIIEENAQVEWFRPLVERKPEGNVVGTLKSLHRISGRVQDMSLGSSVWAEVFASEGFYDGEHVIKLLQSKNYQAILKLVQKQGLTKEQYTAMLFGPLSAQAPQFEAYVKK